MRDSVLKPASPGPSSQLGCRRWQSLCWNDHFITGFSQWGGAVPGTQLQQAVRRGSCSCQGRTSSRMKGGCQHVVPLLYTCDSPAGDRVLQKPLPAHYVVKGTGPHFMGSWCLRTRGFCPWGPGRFAGIPTALHKIFYTEQSVQHLT